MKKLFLFGALALLLASCGSTNELTHNLNNHTTQVVLSKKNFNVVEHVKGEASNFADGEVFIPFLLTDLIGILK